MKFLFRSVERERNFQKKNILSLTDFYLNTDIMEKVQDDEGYKDKLDLIETYLGNEKGWILDIGSHTCGEAEYLATKGYSIICSEINEYALDISRQRCEKFGRNHLKYVACDGHHLPFQDASIHYVTFNESLHHMDNPEQTLSEVARILVPGGKVFFYEPYAYNPYRRLAEIRDYFTGTIEKSFSIGQLKNMLHHAGLETTKVQRHIAVPSRRKMDRVSPFRRFLKQLYYDVSVKLPDVFGMIAVLGKKPGTMEANVDKKEFSNLLQCPKTASALQKTESGWNNSDAQKHYQYASLNGIPILISQDAQPVGNPQESMTA